MSKTVLELVKSDVAEGATNTPRPLTQPSDSAEGGLLVDATQTPEEWRAVPGYGEKYEASSTGRIRTVARTVVMRNGVKRHFKSREISQTDCKGYLRVVIYDAGVVRVNRYVHTLVCSAFHGTKPEPGLQVRHISGECRDNRAENLAWGSISENMLDRVRHGTDPQTARTHCPQGHPYDEVNTYYSPGTGWRQCRMCICARSAARRIRK